MKNVDVGWGPIGLNEIRRKNTKLKLSNSYLELELNSSYKIEINSNYEETPVWISSNENVVVVDQDGNISAIGYGISYVKVTSGNYEGTCVVSVPKPQEEPEDEPQDKPETPDEPDVPVDPDEPVIPEDPVIPEEPENKLDNSKIYYGTIQSPSFMSYAELTESEIMRAVEEGTLVSTEVNPMVDQITVQNEGDAIVVLIPTNEYKAFKDNGSGAKIEFKDNASGYEVDVNGEVKIGDFYVYGEMMFLTTGKLTIYVE